MSYSMSQPLSMIPAEPGSRVACAGPRGWLIYPILAWAVVEEITVDNDDDLAELGPGWRHTHVEPVILEPSVGPTVGEPPHARRWLMPGEDDPTPAECEEAWAEVLEARKLTREREAQRQRDEAERKAKAAQFRADARARLAGSPPSPSPEAAVPPALCKDDVRAPLGQQVQ